MASIYMLLSTSLEASHGESSIHKQVNAIRAFNRFYTRKIGVLDGMASSPFSLAEARVFYELANRRQPTATDLRKELELDAGYMSRILRDFERRKLVKRERSKTDERQRFLSLTSKGRSAFAPLDARSNRDIAAMLKELSPTERKKLVDSVQTVGRLLGGIAEAKTSYLLRPHQPGDMGWIVHRQAILYADEYGWDGTYEALAAEIVAQFIKNYDPKREQRMGGRKGWRKGWRRFRCQGIRGNCKTPAVARGTASARTRHWQTASGGMYPIRAAGRLPKDDAYGRRAFFTRRDTSTKRQDSKSCTKKSITALERILRRRPGSSI